MTGDQQPVEWPETPYRTTPHLQPPGGWPQARGRRHLRIPAPRHPHDGPARAGDVLGRIMLAIVSSLMMRLAAGLVARVDGRRAHPVSGWPRGAHPVAGPPRRRTRPGELVLGIVSCILGNIFLLLATAATGILADGSNLGALVLIGGNVAAMAVPGTHGHRSFAVGWALGYVVGPALLIAGIIALAVLGAD